MRIDKPTLVEVLTSAQVTSLNAQYFGGLSTAQVAVLGTAAVQALNVSLLNSLSSSAFVQVSGALGTPSSGNLTNCTNLALTTTAIPALTTANIAALTSLTGTNTGNQTGGTPALVLSTAQVAGLSTNFIRRDDTILVFDTTVPTTQAFSDSAAVGTATVAARRDHKHAMMAAPTTVSGNAGSATKVTVTADNTATTYYPVFAATGAGAALDLFNDPTTTPLSYVPSTSTLTASTFAGALTGTASGNLVSGGALGTPSSGTLSSCSGYPAASTTIAGLAPSATAPASTFINVVAIANAETAYTNKALFVAGNPATQAFGDAGGAGTAVTAARSDHKHPMMAAPTTITGNAGSATQVIVTADNTATTYYPLFSAAGAGAALGVLNDPTTTPLSYVPSTSTLTASTFAGALTGNASGSSASCTGNAATATSLTGGAGGSIPYQSSAATTAMLANGTAGQFLRSAGTTVAPAWSTPTYPNTATSGKVLVGDGTNVVLSTPTFPNASATAGKVIASDGTNWVASTPTFPNASATTRKIVVSDGTNWVASTETYAIPGTSGNVLTSNGTNWTSTAPSSPSKPMAILAYLGAF